MADNSLTFKVIGTQISGDISGPFSQTPFLFCLARLVDDGVVFLCEASPPGQPFVEDKVYEAARFVVCNWKGKR